MAIKISELTNGLAAWSSDNVSVCQCHLGDWGREIDSPRVWGCSFLKCLFLEGENYIFKRQESFILFEDAFKIFHRKSLSNV